MQKFISKQGNNENEKILKNQDLIDKQFDEKQFENQDSIEKDKSMTSAITDMTVADVRKALSSMRKEWNKHSCVQPFFPSQMITPEMTVSEFAFKFVMGHHAKRHAKTIMKDDL